MYHLLAQPPGIKHYQRLEELLFLVKACSKQLELRQENINGLIERLGKADDSAVMKSLIKAQASYIRMTKVAARIMAARVRLSQQW